jgi:hypothetical protein
MEPAAPLLRVSAIGMNGKSEIRATYGGLFAASDSPGRGAGQTAEVFVP